MGLVDHLNERRGVGHIEDPAIFARLDPAIVSLCYMVGVSVSIVCPHMSTKLTVFPRNHPREVSVSPFYPPRFKGWKIQQKCLGFVEEKQHLQESPSKTSQKTSDKKCPKQPPKHHEETHNSHKPTMRKNLGNPDLEVLI